MELKEYQQDVINHLTEFIEELEQTNQIDKAFFNFWDKKGFPINNLQNDFLKPYDNSIKGVPRVTVKVPTAGGKTFIACNALKPIFDSFPLDKPKVVVWFVPSDTILKQTYKNLNDTSHPYRQKIDAHFNSRVKVYDKEALLFGQGFNPTEVQEQVSILVLSVQSFVETVRKGLPRAYRENENLVEFAKHYKTLQANLENVEDSALVQVIAYLNPIVIIDESHNFEADLRIDMLNNINPSFVFDLTATPKNKSNIVSFVDAIQLKKNNMVKLPVIVYNHEDTNEVINSAIQLQKTLEQKAIQQEKEGGKYIRPIVLFQAQPKTADDNITFEKIKESLTDIGIPENQIRIKTANIDEIKNEDLLSKECEVRFIITVNALKEGWDCPFAYILASLANKSSSVDVEQILGRVLRLPYVTKHQQDLLNYSYVFTSSNNFLNTLDKIILGLNKSGFSSKDYRIQEHQLVEKTATSSESFENIFGKSFDETSKTEASEEIVIDIKQVNEISSSKKGESQVNAIIELAIKTNTEFEKKIEELDKSEHLIPSELKDKIPTFEIKDTFKEESEKVFLPTFYIKVAPSLLENESYVSLTKNLLLKDFDLDKEDSKIELTRTSSQLYRVDLTEIREGEYVPEYRKVNNEVKQAFVKYISTLSPEGKISQISKRLTVLIKKVDEIALPQITAYIKKVIKPLDSEKISEIANNELIYSDIFKQKIKELSTKYAQESFIKMLDKGNIVCRPTFKFSKTIQPKNTQQGVTKNLYIEEGEMNDFEKKVINEIANLDSVVFWHRNLERGKGFELNGFINHYPDFILKMKNGKIIIIETKGDYLDGSDSQNKLKLGEKWASKAGDEYRYFMVFETKKLSGAKTIPEILDILNEMK
jgi:type III restriction enzyme